MSEVISGSMSARGPDPRMMHCRSATADLMARLMVMGAASAHMELQDEGDTVLARCRSHALNQPEAEVRLRKCPRCGGIAGAAEDLSVTLPDGTRETAEARGFGSHDQGCPGALVGEVLKG